MKGKLVRDRIPEIIEKNDKRKPRTKKLSRREFERELRKKLVEEASEASKATHLSLPEELADIEEIIDALCKIYKLKRSTITKIKNIKRAKRGSFKKKDFFDHLTWHLSTHTRIKMSPRPGYLCSYFSAWSSAWAGQCHGTSTTPGCWSLP